MYNSDKVTVSAALQAANPIIFSNETLARIASLTTTANDPTVVVDQVSVAQGGAAIVGSGTEIALVTTSDTVQTTLTPPTNVPVVVFQGQGGVNVVFNGGSTVPAHAPFVTDRVVVGSAGQDHIVIADQANTQVTLGSGGSLVEAGKGYDTVVAGLGNDTVVGGAGGRTTVQLDGQESDYTVKVVGQNVVITDAKDGSVTTTSHVNYVQLDDGEALVFVKDAEEASVAVLYETVFGRAADKTGLEFWLKAAGANASLTDIAKLFISSAEYQELHAVDNASDAQFLENLYQHTFGRDADDVGMEFFMNALTHGVTRGEVAAAFATAASGAIAGTDHTEAHIVGAITVVGDIV